MENENGSYFFLSILANILQVADFQMNVTQLSNDDLMRHLLEQDKILDTQNKALDDQTNNYLKKIIEQNEIIIKQNEEIIRLLKGVKEDAR